MTITSDPMFVLGTVFATAAAPAITELIKIYRIPKGLSPCLTSLVAIALYTIGWFINPDGGTYGEYLLVALSTAGVSTASFSVARLQEPMRQIRDRREAAAEHEAARENLRRAAPPREERLARALPAQGPERA